MEPILTLRDAIVAKLVAMGKDAVARYVHYEKREDIADGKWIVALAEQNEEKQFRNVDDIRLVIDIVYQRALPKPTTSFPNPLTNLPFLDACIEEAGTVKALFREGGPLRGAVIGNAVQVGRPLTQLFVPDHLLNHLIFTAPIRVEFDHEGAD